MNFAEITKEIAENFPKAKTEPLKKHPLAKKIEHEWRDQIKRIAPSPILQKFIISSSAGIGAWNSAPWLAILHPEITKSARSGFYPVYLFEPGFKSFCLVLGQGAARLEEAVGKKMALIELERRAKLLRELASQWEENGFHTGPFATLRKAAVTSNADKNHNDPWSVSVAFGKRYFISSLPSDEVLGEDLKSMLEIYSKLVFQVNTAGLDFTTQDNELCNLKDSGEIPKGTVDGAKMVVAHKNYEFRNRNSSLIRKVKKNLGYTCGACGFKFGEMYGDVMNNYIEAHHLVPISSLDDAGDTLQPTADDFAVLCSNCHRAIHAAGCPSLQDFRHGLQRKLKLV